MEIKNILDESETPVAPPPAEAAGSGESPATPPPHSHHWSAKIIIAVSLLLAFAAAAAIIWYFFVGPGRDQTAKSSPTPSVSASAFVAASPSSSASATTSPVAASTPTPSAVSSWFNLKELGVRFRNTSADLAGLRYTYKADTRGAAYFGTADLAALNASCTNGSLGAITRYAYGDQIFGEPVQQLAAAKRIGNYYFVFEESQSYCGGDETTAAGRLQTKQKTALYNEALSTLEAIPGVQQ